jgi:hypothetical protein
MQDVYNRCDVPSCTKGYYWLTLDGIQVCQEHVEEIDRMRLVYGKEKERA